MRSFPTSSTAPTNDSITAGLFDQVREPGVMLSGEGVRTVGSVLGKVTLGAATPVKTGTGNGTFTMDATTPLLANAQVGVYTALCTVAGTNTFTFEIRDPKGNLLGTTVQAATFANQLKFVIADGSTDFIVGDSFAITVVAGSGKLKLLSKAALDGSQVPYGILLDDTLDATSADVPCSVVRTGEFDASRLIFVSGTVLADVKLALEAINIYTQTTIARV